MKVKEHQQNSLKSREILIKQHNDTIQTTQDLVSSVQERSTKRSIKTEL